MTIATTVDEALQSRRSIRAYLPKPVPRETLEDLLKVASRAPSGTNTQPWKVYVLQGASREGLCDKIMAAYNDPEEAATHKEEYPYYPSQWISPYIDRRRKVGFDLYGILGIKKGETAKMHEQHGRNYRFFDAPVGLIFTIDRVMAQGSWLDYGMLFVHISCGDRHGAHVLSVLDGGCPDGVPVRSLRVLLTSCSLP